MIPERTDVLIVGGGPAGATAAAILAKQGIDTVLLERDIFPRYHVGESLLPALIPILDLTGARQKVEAHGFVRKPGGYFEWGHERWSLAFGELSGIPSYSYQVIRSEFDHLLLRNAEEKGAKVFQDVTVRELQFDGDRPVLAHYDTKRAAGLGKVRFKCMIDCSGRYGLLANRHFRARRYHEAFKNVAIWSYWKNADIERVGQAGAIRVFSVPNGWIWCIPLHDGSLSVGVVLHHEHLRRALDRSSMEALYERILTDHPQSRSMLQHATHGETRREQDYSYTSDRFAGPGYFIAGDAACFLDPLLSSGVHLAMFSGLIAAAAITSVLARDVSEEQAAAFFEKSYRRAYLRFLVFVSAFYDQNRGQRGYFWEAQRLTSRDYREDDLKKAFISLISGSEDISDAQDARGDAIIERIAGRIQENLRLRGDKSNLDPEHEAATGNARFFDAIEGLFVLSKAHAIDGMFVETGSMVRLAHV